MQPELCSGVSARISQEVTDFLALALVDALRATVQGSENRIARLLFKLTVEISMMMHVLAAGLEIDDSQLDDLRWRCVQEVKKTNGGIKFKDVLLWLFPPTCGMVCRYRRR